MSFLSQLLKVNIDFIHPSEGNKLDQAGHELLTALAPVAEVFAPTLEERLQSAFDAALVKVATAAVATGAQAAPVAQLAQSESTGFAAEMQNALSAFGWEPSTPVQTAAIAVKATDAPISAAPVYVPDPTPDPTPAPPGA